jgi:hypothetical protein
MVSLDEPIETAQQAFTLLLESNHPAFTYTLEPI